MPAASGWGTVCVCLPGTGDLSPLSLINSQASPVLLRTAWHFPVRVKGHLKADTQITTFSSTVYSRAPFLPRSQAGTLVHTLNQGTRTRDKPCGLQGKPAAPKEAHPHLEAGGRGGAQRQDTLGEG